MVGCRVCFREDHTGRQEFWEIWAASNHKAKKFWAKYAVANKEAKYLLLMMYAIDVRYKLCVDTTFAMMRV